ncbi:MAG: ribonucleotide-diphosphate reductase subunit beta, partial [Candidatus Pacebacteria bacterium]|nr:ribonucleotide-diphosphate reductase subunit beta [Candidatus Paceibacterota bacterium]
MKNNFSIRKRDGSIVPFDIDKIANAIYRAMIAVNKGEKESSKNIAKKVFKKIEIIEKEKRKNVNIPYKNITVEEIQDIVEKELMANSFYDVAKSYIIYREKRAILRKRDIFKKRINLKPYEYPELYEYVNAIRHSYWIHTEFNYLSDIQDFKANITEKERSAIKKTMLAIAQIEVAVKSFWGDIYKKMPKPEIASVGFTFAESEVRHMDAYSHLLEILGLNEEFTKIEEVPVLMERIKYLENSIKTSKSEDNKEITK